MFFFSVMLKSAIHNVINDTSFHLKVEAAATALQQARCVAEWSGKEENEPIFEEFEKRLLDELKTCLPPNAASSGARSFGSIRSDICRNYHRVRTSSTFVAIWNDLIKRASHTNAQPTFYQEVTDILFEGIVTSALPVSGNTAPEAAIITVDDANVINYAAGFVCRKVHDSILRSSRPDKLELLGCVARLKEGDEEGTSPSGAWVTEVDRGGLWHVSEATCMLFSAMEEEVREHFRAVDLSQEGRSERLTSAVTSNDEVLFHWCMLTAETDEVHAQTVLDMIISLWIRIRGFSYASTFIELYKQEKKKGLQRSKALRKDIS